MHQHMQLTASSETSNPVRLLNKANNRQKLQACRTMLPNKRAVSSLPQRCKETDLTGS